jgi:hypothetical protein
MDDLPVAARRYLRTANPVITTYAASMPNQLCLGAPPTAVEPSLRASATGRSKLVDFGSLATSPSLKNIALMMTAIVASLAGLGVCLSLRLSDNVHVIESGLAYRSGQLWPGELELVIEDYGDPQHHQPNSSCARPVLVSR